MRSRLFWLLCIFLLLISSQGGASAQNRKRTKKSAQTKLPVAEIDMPALAGATPNPLLLVVSVTEARQVLLNTEDEGTLSDLSQLRARLEKIFAERTQVGAFRPGTDEIEKTVIFKNSAYLTDEEFRKIVEELQAAGASTIEIMTEAQYKAKFEDAGVSSPPRQLSEAERKRILRMAPVSGGVLNGKALSLPQPEYPAIARKAKASGKVTVEIIIDEAGRVISARALSGHPLLRAAAVNSARQARFSPTRLSDQPVKVMGVLIYNFELP